MFGLFAWLFLLLAFWFVDAFVLGVSTRYVISPGHQEG